MIRAPAALSDEDEDRERTAPLVSIALCTYNGERFLAQQLDSLLAQTHANIEIVAT